MGTEMNRSFPHSKGLMLEKQRRTWIFSCKSSLLTASPKTMAQPSFRVLQEFNLPDMILNVLAW